MDKQGNATEQAFYRNAEGHEQEYEEEEEQEQKQKHKEGLPGTPEELQMLLQAEGDRRVTQALKTASVKWQQELLEKVKAEKSEVERLAGQLIEKAEKEALEKYARELDCKERALEKKELELKIICLLAQNKLPLELKDFLADKDEASAMKMLETLIRLWRDNFNTAVSVALSGLQSKQE